MSDSTQSDNSKAPSKWYQDSKGDSSSTRLIAMFSSIIGYVVILTLVIGMLFGKFKDVDLSVFLLTIPLLLGGPMAMKAHQNHRKKQES